MIRRQAGSIYHFWSGLLATLLAASFLLTACSTAGTSSDNAQDAPPVNPGIVDEAVTLDVWLNLEMVASDPLFEEIAADFEEAYPNVDVNLQAYVRETMPGKTRSALQIGNPPDVVQGHVTAMAAQGFAEPLDNLWAEWEAESEFLPQAMEQVTWDKVKYGVPLDIYTLVLVYNKAHFDAAGLAYPEAGYIWQRFAQDVATLTQPDGSQYGLGFTSDPWYVFAWLTEAGGDVVSGDSFIGYRVTLDTPNNVDGLRFLTSMARNGYGPLPSTRPRDYEDPRKLFLDGRVSMFFGTPYDIHVILQENPDFPIGVVELPVTPAGVGAASALGTTGLFVPRGSQNRRVAFEFMKWVTSDRYALPMATRLGHYTSRAWLLTTPHVAGNPLLKPFLIQLNAARPYVLDAWPEAERAYQNAIKASFYNADPGDALKQAQEEAERVPSQQ